MARGKLRRLVYDQLEPTARKGRLSPTNRVIVVLVIIAAFTVIFETEPTISAGREPLFRLFELLFGIIFLVEFAARVWIAPDSPRFAGKPRPRLSYIVSWNAIIDMIAILPSLFAFADGSSIILRFFRILRMVRLAKLGRLSRAWRHVTQAIHSRRYELGLTVAIAVAAMLTAGTGLYLTEAEAQPDKFGSIPRALWWAIVTLTTVGYGDAYPITAAGKVVAGVVAVIGVGLIALPTGILASAFSEAVQKRSASDAADKED
jgi:voltage-gated potassium channel